MSVTPTPQVHDVLDALVTATAQVLGLESDDISPENRFGDFDVDSVSAIEIVVQLGDTLGDVVDARELLVDWTELTMLQLATDLAATLARRGDSSPATSDASTISPPAEGPGTPATEDV